MLCNDMRSAHKKKRLEETANFAVTPSVLKFIESVTYLLARLFVAGRSVGCLVARLFGWLIC